MQLCSSSSSSSSGVDLRSECGLVNYFGYVVGY
jgi:hypothetical protein